MKNKKYLCTSILFFIAFIGGKDLQEKVILIVETFEFKESDSDVHSSVTTIYFLEKYHRDCLQIGHLKLSALSGPCFEKSHIEYCIVFASLIANKY